MNDPHAPILVTPAPDLATQSRKILNSWKEIACYIGRGVRTVQRYEVQYGFPVHRAAGAPHSSVMAFSDEVDVWLRHTPVLSHLSRMSNVIEMSPSTFVLTNGDHRGDACPFCRGTGRVHPSASAAKAVNSPSTSSRNGSNPSYAGSNRSRSLSN